MTDEAANVTRLLKDWHEGDRAALDALMPVIHKELRRRAAKYLRGEKPGHTLQPTALVNEVYLRLVETNQPDWQSRGQFFAVASHILRQILVDHARGVNRLKRGGGAVKVTWVEGMGNGPAAGIDLMGLDEALERLSKFDERQCRIVELRFFGGLSIEETAEALGISPATVKREWSIARAWLHHELTSAK